MECQCPEIECWLEDGLTSPNKGSWLQVQVDQCRYINLIDSEINQQDISQHKMCPNKTLISCKMFNLPLANEGGWVGTWRVLLISREHNGYQHDKPANIKAENRDSTLENVIKSLVSYQYIYLTVYISQLMLIPSHDLKSNLKYSCFDYYNLWCKPLWCRIYQMISIHLSPNQ